MSRLYGPIHRSLQDRFDTRRLADNVEARLVRPQGIASVNDNDPLLEDYTEAQLIVRVAVTEIFRNWPRYVHHYKKVQQSEFVPRSTCRAPLAPWKRVDDVQSSLPAKDRARVEREGNMLSRAEYEKYLSDVASTET